MTLGKKEKWSNSVGPLSSPRLNYASQALRGKPTGRPKPVAPRGHAHGRHRAPRARGGAAGAARWRPASQRGQRIEHQGGEVHPPGNK
jgi:hypothetical protein